MTDHLPDEAPEPECWPLTRDPIDGDHPADLIHVDPPRGLNFHYVRDLEDCGIYLADDGTSAVLHWGDGVANCWTEEHADLPTAVARLAVLLHCGATGKSGSNLIPDGFAETAARMFIEAAS